MTLHLTLIQVLDNKIPVEIPREFRGVKIESSGKTYKECVNKAEQLISSYFNPRRNSRGKKLDQKLTISYIVDRIVI